MSINPLGTAFKPQQGVDSLVQQLVKQADANNDGQISTAEFRGFLKRLVASMAGANAARKQFSPVRVDPNDGSDPTNPATPGILQSRDILPSNWTDNNAPYGVTFAGFSPQDHTNLTLDDLGVPGKAEKYAAYNYLLSNQIRPTNDWAPLAAEALNKKYNTTAYRAIDGETLGFGKEYIHSAPNGYGMARSTYNPASTGEFFWGNA